MQPFPHPYTIDATILSGGVHAPITCRIWA